MYMETFTQFFFQPASESTAAKNNHSKWKSNTMCDAVFWFEKKRTLARTVYYYFSNHVRFILVTSTTLQVILNCVWIDERYLRMKRIYTKPHIIKCELSAECFPRIHWWRNVYKKHIVASNKKIIILRNKVNLVYTYRIYWKSTHTSANDRLFKARNVCR